MEALAYGLGSYELTLFCFVFTAVLIKMLAHPLNNPQTVSFWISINQVPDANDVASVLSPLELLWFVDVVVSAVELLSENGVQC